MQFRKELGKPVQSSKKAETIAILQNNLKVNNSTLINFFIASDTKWKEILLGQCERSVKR